MTFPLSRTLSAATAAYGVFALVMPGHLASVLEAAPARRPAFDLLAYTYGARDLSVSAVALTASSPSVVTTAMVLRIVGDLSDAAVLGLTTTDPKVRKKVLGATLGWAAANTLALVTDRRRER
ncbi:MAG: hypothetical protein ACR2FG_05740 [Marmoricola sp.]